MSNGTQQQTTISDPPEKEKKLIQDLLKKSGASEYGDETISGIYDYYDGNIDSIATGILDKAGAEYDEQTIPEIKEYYGISSQPTEQKEPPKPKPEDVFEGTEYNSIDDVQKKKSKLEGRLNFVTGPMSMGRLPEKEEKWQQEIEQLNSIMDRYEEAVQQDKSLANPQNLDPDEYLTQLQQVREQYGDVEGTEKEDVEESKEAADYLSDSKWLPALRVGLRSVTGGTAFSVDPDAVTEELAKPQTLERMSEAEKLNTYAVGINAAYHETEEKIKENYGKDVYDDLKKVFKFKDQGGNINLDQETGELKFTNEQGQGVDLGKSFTPELIQQIERDPLFKKMGALAQKQIETSARIRDLGKKYPLTKVVQDIAKKDKQSLDELHKNSSGVGRALLSAATVLSETPREFASDAIEAGINIGGLFNPEIGAAYAKGKEVEQIPNRTDFTSSRQKRPVRERVVNFQGYKVGVDDEGEPIAFYDEEGYATDAPSQEFIDEFNESGLGKSAEKQWNGESLVYNGLKTARDVGITMAYTSTGMGAGLGAGSAITAGVAFQYNNDFLQEGIEAGLDFRSAYGSALARGIKSGLVNRINPLEAGIISSAFSRGVSKANVEALRGAVTGATKNKNLLFNISMQMAAEQAEEQIDEFTDVQWMDFLDSKLDDVDHNAKFDALEVMALTGFATLAPATTVSIANYNQIESDPFYRESLYKAAANPEKYTGILSDLVEKGSLKQKDADAQRSRIESHANKYSELLDSDRLTEGQKMDVIANADIIYVNGEKSTKLTGNRKQASDERVQQAEEEIKTIEEALENDQTKELEQYHKENGTYVGFYTDPEAEQTVPDINVKNIRTSDIENRRNRAVEQGNVQLVQEIETEMKGRGLEFDSQLDEAVENQPEETVTETDEVITEEEYNRFVDEGVVEEPVLQSIAEKVRKGGNLTQRETAIFQDKTSEINEILKDPSLYGDRQDALGSVVRYGNQEGTLVQEDGLFYVENEEGRTLVEAALSDRTNEEIGLEVVRPAEEIEIDEDVARGEGVETDFTNNKVFAYGKEYDYRQTNTNEEGDAVSVTVTDRQGNERTIRSEDVVAQIETDKILFELENQGNDITEGNIIEIAEREGITPERDASDVQTEGQTEVSETPTQRVRREQEEEKQRIREIEDKLSDWAELLDQELRELSETDTQVQEMQNNFVRQFDERAVDRRDNPAAKKTNAATVAAAVSGRVPQRIIDAVGVENIEQVKELASEWRNRMKEDTPTRRAEELTAARREEAQLMREQREEQAAELRARQEETVEQMPEETVEEVTEETQQEAEPTEEVVEETEPTEQVEQEQTVEPEEGVQYVRRDIGGGETQVLRVDPDGTKTPVNEDMVPEGAEVTQETEPAERSPQKEYTRYVQRLLAEENNAPQEVKDYVRKSETKQQPKLSLSHIISMAKQAVDGVTTLEGIHATRDMLVERTSNVEVIRNDPNGWELLAMRLLAKRASNLGYEQLAAEIEIEIGNAGRRYGQAIMSLRVIEDLDTHVDLMAKRLFSEDTQNLNKKNEVTGKTPLEQMSELIDKIKPDQETTNKFLEELRKKFPEELATKKEPTRKRRAGTTLKMSETEIKAQNAYDRFQQALKESKGYAGALGNPKLFEAAFELMKYAYYKAKGSIEQATNIFNRVKEENELDIEANEVLESSEFVKFREGADQTIAQQEQQRKERIVKNFADRILNPKRGAKTAQSELSKALATVKRNQREDASDSSIAEDIRKNGVTLDELIEAKTIVEEKLEADPADKATLLNQIDDIIEAVTGKAIKKAKLRKEIARGAKSLNRTVLDLAKDYYTQKQVKKDLVAEIIESTGLDKAEAQKYADQIEQTFDEIIADHVEKIATKERDSFIKENLRLAKEELKELVAERDALQEKDKLTREERNRLRELESKIKKTGKLIKTARRRVKRALKSAPSIKRLVELVKTGLLDEKQLSYEFYELFDLNPLKRSEQKELVRLIREYESKKRDIDKQKAIHEITDFLRDNAKKMSKPEIFMSMTNEYWYKNMLSNLYTPLRALAGNTFVFLTKHLTPDIIATVKDGITKDPAVFKVFAKSFADGMRGLYQVRSSVGDVLATGQTTEIIFDIDSKVLNSQKVIEEWIQKKITESRKDLKEGGILSKAKALGLMMVLTTPIVQTVIVRALISMDIISKSFIIPYLSNQVAMQEVLKQGYDKNAVDLVSEVDKLIGKTSSLRRAVIEDANEQGFIKPSHTYKGKQYVGTESNPELDSKGNRIPYTEYKKTDDYKEGLKERKKYEKFRYNELLPEFADDFVNREATIMATEMAMQGAVFGGIGKYMNPLIDFKQKAATEHSMGDKAKALGLTLLFPFMRLGGISYNLIKGATPFNLLQIARNEEGHWDRDQGVWGLKLRDERRKWKSSNRLEESTQLSHYEKMVNYRYAVAPTMMVAAYMAMLFDIEWDEDEQQWGLKLEDENWRITGGNLPYSETQTREGYEHYAIQYKKDDGTWGTVLNYDDIPLGVLLSPIGDMSDEMYTNPKTDFIGWDAALMYVFSGATNFVSNYGWSSTLNAITSFGDAIAGVFSPQESLQENYNLEQFTKRIVRPGLPGGGLFSFINRAAIKYAGTEPKEGNEAFGKAIYGGWGDPLSDNILTSWMFDNVRLDAFGQPYQPDMDNPIIADFIEGMYEDNISEVTSGFIAPKREKPEYVKELQKFERANGIGLYYPYKTAQKTKRDIKYTVIEGIPGNTLDNITRKTSENVRKIAVDFLDEIKDIDNHVDMLNVHNTIMSQAQGHAWGEEMLDILEQNELWDVEREDFLAYPKTFGVTKDKAHYEPSKIKDYLFNNGLKLEGTKLRPYEYKVRVGNIEVED